MASLEGSHLSAALCSEVVVVVENALKSQGTMFPALCHLCHGMPPTPVFSVGPVRTYLSWGNEQRCRRLLKASTNCYRQESVSAAVLVSLCSVAGVPAVLYTLRSSTMTGSHKGDVSFPGGKRDSCDRDAITTALRETREELNLRVGEDCIWGVMKPLPDRRGLTVAPVLANLGPLEHLTLKPNSQEVEDRTIDLMGRENYLSGAMGLRVVYFVTVMSMYPVFLWDKVETVFTLPISHLLQEENQGYTNFCHKRQYSHTLPVFLHGPHRIWGLTAVITDLTLELLAPGTYHRWTRMRTTRSSL